MLLLQLKFMLLVCAVSSKIFAQDLPGDVEVGELLKVKFKILWILDASTLQMTDVDKTQNGSAAAVEDQLVKQIYELIEHFKQEDPVGLPLVPLPDPTVRSLTQCFLSTQWLCDFSRTFQMWTRESQWQTYRWEKWNSLASRSSASSSCRRKSKKWLRNAGSPSMRWCWRGITC